ncbi:hypothetical protein SAMD00019534_124020 [Acytostelium subglobosum LB1]|uniref:hypothetical protein n=1 Tax=Acytostelium subglobosum LB1 TaxID=1410327 RepID=UPI00064490E8|nr:hypothetical protein SAMD00019534_124020 [Acytostelium subglobosum LB1]GAM29226.1 hypothetical protein SAMD00019534_124020 [Acytostelium subglobosum LB1]|eukprot:XP_012747800.1 hypothetical protein SAMD00019534_124020 [Acytostelium subglobosum LB1]
MDEAEETIACRRLNVAAHSVLGDAKLCMAIIGHVSNIFRDRLGINSNKLIKGRQLLYNESLHDYIKYGATEWLVKSLDDHYAGPSRPYPYPFNKKLMDVAINRSDNHTLSTLYALPSLTMGMGNGTRIVDPKYLSQCSDPSWTQILEDVIWMSQRRIEIAPNYMVQLDDPLFLRQCILSGVDIKPLKEYIYPKDVKYLFPWLTKPWAMEMLQLLHEKNIVNDKSMCTILSMSTKDHLHHITNFILQHYPTILETNLEYLVPECSSNGNLELFGIMAGSNVLLPEHLENIFSMASAKGHLAIVINANNMLQTLHNWCFSMLPYLGEALSNGHLYVVNYILGAPPVERSTAVNVAAEMFIVDIHHSIISLDLIARLFQVPNLHHSYKNVMASAIKAGDREVIERLEQGHKYLKTDYSIALGMAAIVGDEISATMILDKHKHLCLPIKLMSGATFDPKDWALVHPNIGIMIANIIDPDKHQIMVGHVVSSLDIPGSTATSKCRKCSTEIVGETVHALDADWCAKCFTCSMCNQPLKSYFLSSAGKPLCKVDYERTALDKCVSCHTPITGQKLTDNIGQHYHPECFRCTTCNIAMDGQFFVRNGQIKCTACNEHLKNEEKKTIGKEMGPCGFCTKGCNTAEGTVIVISPEERYHRHCFKCVKCKNEIQGEFYTLDNVKSSKYLVDTSTSFPY